MKKIRIDCDEIQISFKKYKEGNLIRFDEKVAYLTIINGHIKNENNYDMLTIGDLKQKKIIFEFNIKK